MYNYNIKHIPAFSYLTWKYENTLALRLQFLFKSNFICLYLLCSGVIIQIWYDTKVMILDKNKNKTQCDN